MQDTMSKETVETLQNIVSYYDHHTVEKMVETNPGFVVEDFKKVLDLIRAQVYSN